MFGDERNRNKFLPAIIRRIHVMIDTELALMFFRCF